MLIGKYTRDVNKDTKLYFVHVPKTAGTTVNTIFRNIFGALSCTFHAESMLLPPGSREINAEFCRQSNYIAAHLPYDFYAVHFKPFGYRALVTVRNPIEHFKSQIAHIIRSPTKLDGEYEGIRQKLKLDANEFFKTYSLDRLENFRAMQSKSIFGSHRMRVGSNTLSRVSWLLQEYDTVVLTDKVSNLYDCVTINGARLNFAMPQENLRPANCEFEIEITDKILELLHEDIIIYDEISKINSLAGEYWRQLVR